VKSVPNRKKQYAKPIQNERTVRVSVGKCSAAIVGGCLLLGLVGFAFVRHASTSKLEWAKLPVGSVSVKQPTTLAELLALKPESLSAVDIGVLNMLCAQGLPGAEDMKIANYQATLDQWARHVKSRCRRAIQNPKSLFSARSRP
jgi:hypothetical protein